ncbi:MAG: short-chain dehydrogenase [Rhodospirillaceae bacterium]|nr:short-chain dehydrogenase [Rhodospirillaceae bacterium]HAA91236.1 short-chain dehydrogenase [Rhodospirillaceae bacterium]
MKLFDLAGKTALVTGSTKGIGRAIVNRLAEHGANVVVSSRKAEVCDEVAAEVNETWATGEARAAAIPCNIQHKDQLQTLVDGTLETFGAIDILVCNAAVNPYFGPSKDTPDDAFDRTMESNVRSNFWLCNMVLPQMIEREGGSITLISSIGGIRGRPLLGIYGISKAADMQIARNLAVEYGPQNIRVNCIAPGLIRTDFARALWENPDILKERTATTPLRRIGEPDEVAGAVVFLASDAGSFITGETLVIDGGVTII